MVRPNSDKEPNSEQEPRAKRGRGAFLASVFRSQPHLWSLVFSLILHSSLVFALLFFLVDTSAHKRKEALRVWLTGKTETKAPEKIVNPEKRLVVNLAPAPNTKRPNEAKYLAEQDSSATKEQHATSSRRGSPASSSDDARKPQKARKASAPTFGYAPTKQADTSDPLRIKPDFSHNDATLGDSSNDEYLPDIDRGEHTELNAWQWRHAPFFNRIKERIAQIWAPQAQIMRFDPQGVLLGKKDRVTVLTVTIDRSGTLRNLKIIDHSGVIYLDEEAERAFRQAAPFLYPPEDLFQNREEFSFNFAFHLFVDRGFSLGFDWNNN